MRLIVTEAARSDLLRIGDYIAQDNPRRALTFVAELEARCRALLATPLAYPVIALRPGREVRRLVHGRYLVFYRVEAEQIVILRILAGSMNLDALLGIAR